jgi:hypothetical protein
MLTKSSSTGVHSTSDDTASGMQDGAASCRTAPLRPSPPSVDSDQPESVELDADALLENAGVATEARCCAAAVEVV